MSHATANGHGRTTATIAFDTWCLGGHARNQGVHVYAGQLLSHFREMGPRFGIEFAPYVSAGADNQANSFAAAPGFRPRETGLLKFSRVWRYGGACTLASLQRVDLVFSPHCTSLYFGNLAPAVVTIHDVIPLVGHWGLPRVSQILRFFLWWSAKASRAIITVSEYSKMDLLNAYGLPESKVSVIYNGYDKTIFNTVAPGPGLQHLLKQLGVARPYILHHGAIKPNKNLARLIQAFHLLVERNKNLDMDLVLAGPFGWEYEGVLAAANQGPGNVIFTGALSDQELGLLVKGASLAVFPSLYEGFCLPLVEAMACGVPTIASSSSCLPEVSGGALRYFDPLSTEEMASCMEEALESEDLKRELAEKGQARANEFDWQRSAEETMMVLRSQLTNGN
ncbi:MAG TPA: glycosyltransferase family 1 protein [Candidatus Angelobacter sp.]